MKKYDELRCRDCPGYKYCRGRVMKGSSKCDEMRGMRSKKRSKRFDYIRGMVRR